MLVRDLGDGQLSDRIIRQGVAEWNGEGETVGGIVVMRYGMNALNVISGVKQKLAEIVQASAAGRRDRRRLRSRPG